MKRNANTSTKPVAVVADNTAWTFTADSIAINGHQFPVSKYDVTDKGDVYVLATVEGMGIRLHAGHKSPRYHEALEAALAFKTKAADKPAETKPAPVAQEAKPAPAKKPAKAKAAKPADKPAPVAQEAKPAPAKKPAKAKAAKPADKPAPVVQEAKPAPAKKPAETKPAVPADNAWIGTTIEGKGWRIAFDEAAQRTRVILDAEPSAKQKAAIDAAGFYWSNATKSWNKKLTRKAWRAAQALAETLNAIK